MEVTTMITIGLIVLLIGVAVGQLSVWNTLISKTKQGKTYVISTWCWDTDECDIVVNRVKRFGINSD